MSSLAPTSLLLAPTISRDLPCIQCGYSLATMPLEGACPECATPCRDSLLSLYLAHPPDLIRLRRGVGMMIVAGVVFPILLICCAISSSWLRTGSWTGVVGGAFVLMLGPAFACVGGWMITRAVRNAEWTNTPWAISPDHRPQIMGYIGTGYSMCSILGFACILLCEARVLPRSPFDLVAGAFMWCAAAMWQSRNAILFRFASRLASRSSAPRLRNVFSKLSLFAWATGALAIVLALFTLAAEVVARAWPDADWDIGPRMPPDFERSPVGSSATILIIVALLGWMLAMPISLGLLWVQLTRLVRRAKSWAAETSGASDFAKAD